MSLFIFYNICWFLTWPPHQCSQTSRLAIPIDIAFPLTAAHASPCSPSVGHGAPFLCKPQRAECVQQHRCKANAVLGPNPERLWGPSVLPTPNTCSRTKSPALSCSAESLGPGPAAFTLPRGELRALVLLSPCSLVASEKSSKYCRLVKTAPHVTCFS